MRAHGERLPRSVEACMLEARNVRARGQRARAGYGASRGIRFTVDVHPRAEFAAERYFAENWHEFQIQGRLSSGRARRHVDHGGLVAWVFGDQLVCMRCEPEQL